MKGSMLTSFALLALTLCAQSSSAISNDHKTRTGASILDTDSSFYVKSVSWAATKVDLVNGAATVHPEALSFEMAVEFSQPYLSVYDPSPVECEGSVECTFTVETCWDCFVYSDAVDFPVRNILIKVKATPKSVEVHSYNILFSKPFRSSKNVFLAPAKIIVEPIAPPVGAEHHLCFLEKEKVVEASLTVVLDCDPLVPTTNHEQYKFSANTTNGSVPLSALGIFDEAKKQWRIIVEPSGPTAATHFDAQIWVTFPGDTPHHSFVLNGPNLFPYDKTNGLTEYNPEGKTPTNAPREKSNVELAKSNPEGEESDV